MLSGSTAAAIKNALPAFGTSRGRPVRAVTACRLCTAGRRISQPVPVHLPAHHQVCLRRGIWLSGPGTPQFSVRGCPDILAAERQASHLLRRCIIEQLIHAKIQAAAGQDDRAWKRRTLALIMSNPRQVTESSTQALFQAAAYPENIAAAACARETSGRGEKGNKPAGRHEGGLVKRDLPHAIRPGCAGVRRTCRFV